MNNIITNKPSNENAISSKIDKFFSTFSIYKMLKSSNFYKEGGIGCISILKQLLGLVFTGKNLYRTLDLKSGDLDFKKNTAYRFLNSGKYNWTRLLLLIATAIISLINELTSDDRASVLIVDDSLYSRGRSKMVELLSRVFDHTTRKFVKGFKMLTLGWSDGTSFIPVAFSLLSTRHQKKLLCPADNTQNRQSNGFKKRSEAMENATDVMLKLLDSAMGIPAKYLLFDSWFAFPKTIANIVKRKLDVICMLKISSKIHYFYEGEWMDLKSIRNKAKLDSKGNIQGSVVAGIRESKKNPEIIPVRIVFVKDKHSKNWLAVLSTNIKISEEEIIRIYGKRWDIEVFFKMTKHYLSLAKEFQGRSYNMMIAHTTIVMMRYAILSFESRNSMDPRTIGDLFYYFCDEAEDIKFSRSLFMIIDLLKKVLSDNPVIGESLMNEILNTFIKSLPLLWKEKLQLIA